MRDVKVFAQIVLAAIAMIVVGWMLLSLFAASAQAQTLGMEKPSRPAPIPHGTSHLPTPVTKERDGKQGDSASNLTERRVREIVTEELNRRFRPLRDLPTLPLPTKGGSK